MNNSETSREFVSSSEEVIKLFIQNFNQANSSSDFPAPRRFELLSLMIQTLLHNTDICTEIIIAFFEDRDIRQFFKIGKTIPSGIVNGNNIDLCIFDNSGYGGHLQVLPCIASILLTAVDLTVLENKQLKLNMILANIPKSLERFKSFLKKEPIEEEHLVGISGFAIEENLTIGFGGLTAFALDKLQSQYFFGNANTSLAIRESFTRKIIFQGNQKELDKYLSNLKGPINNHSQHVIDLIKNIRLSLVLTLANFDKLLYSFIEGDYLISSTGNSNSFIWRNNHILKKSSDVEIDSTLANKISIKYLTIKDKDLSSINIAMNRLLSATCMRDSLDDMLIDAVMCWENIIGSEHEVTFKVCASMAKLLSENNNDRNLIFKELKTIYNERSELVHGNIKYNTNQNDINKAIIYAAKLMDVIISNDKLLSMANDERSDYILLSS